MVLEYVSVVLGYVFVALGGVSVVLEERLQGGEVYGGRDVHTS